MSSEIAAAERIPPLIKTSGPNRLRRLQSCFRVTFRPMLRKPWIAVAKFGYRLKNDRPTVVTPRAIGAITRGMADRLAGCGTNCDPNVATSAMPWNTGF